MSKNNKEKFGTELPKEALLPKRRRKVKTEPTKSTKTKTKTVKTDNNLPRYRVKKTKEVIKTPKETKPKTETVKTKVKKTPEELHEIRQKAGRKAWETRRSKMSDEQYEQWKKDFVERMQKGKQKKKELGMEVPTTDNIVYFDVFDKVEELLNTLPNAIPIYDKRSGFRYMEWEDSYPLWDTYQNAREDMGDEEYSAWLIQNEEELVTALTNFQHSSDQNSATQHLQTAMNILRGTNALSLSELTALNDYMEKVV